MIKQKNFKTQYGSWALVAGASEGLGLEFARQIARRGLSIILVARRQEKLESVANELCNRYQVECIPLCCDLAQATQVDKLIHQVEDKEVGLLVYNAAYPSIGWFLDQHLSDHEKALQVNCQSVLKITYAFALKMRERMRGGIILLSSMAGFQGSPVIANYAATKSFIRVLAEGLWYELKPFNVDVVACAAGSTDTPNYRKSNPGKLSWLSPPVLPAQKVVEETLNYLGKGPTFIPGRWNRMAAAVIHRLFSRKKAVNTMGKTTEKIYAHYLQ